VLPLQATFEPDTGSLYITFSDPEYGPVARTETGAENLNYMLLDFDGNGKLRGIEIQGARAYFPKHFLERIPAPAT
jgi:uncharacterized protein YuzE